MCLAEKKATGVHRWHGDREARRAVYNNRARLRSGTAKDAFQLRGELVERSFALILDRGGMRRSWLRGRDNLHKRYLVHVAGYNLGLIMRLLVGAGTPREFLARIATHLLILTTAEGAAIVILAVATDTDAAILAVSVAWCRHSGMPLARYPGLRSHSWRPQQLTNGRGTEVVEGDSNAQNQSCSAAGALHTAQTSPATHSLILDLGEGRGGRCGHSGRAGSFSSYFGRQHRACPLDFTHALALACPDPQPLPGHYSRFALWTVLPRWPAIHRTLLTQPNNRLK